MKYKGVTIKVVKITRYQILDPTGKKVATAATLSGAKTYINGYMSAMARMRKEGGH